MNAEKKKRRRQIVSELFILEEIAKSGGIFDEKKARQLGRELDELKKIGRTKPAYAKREDGEELTEELFELAASNGIGKDTLKHRFYNKKWTPEEAATIPVPRLSHIEDSGLTPEIYREEKIEGVLDKDISKNFNVSLSALANFKNLYNISKKTIIEEKG